MQFYEQKVRQFMSNSSSLMLQTNSSINDNISFLWANHCKGPTWQITTLGRC